MEMVDAPKLLAAGLFHCAIEPDTLETLMSRSSFVWANSSSPRSCSVKLVAFRATRGAGSCEAEAPLVGGRTVALVEEPVHLEAKTAVWRGEEVRARRTSRRRRRKRRVDGVLRILSRRSRRASMAGAPD